MGPLYVAEGKSKSLLRNPLSLVTVWLHQDTRKVLHEAGRLTIMLMFIIVNALILKYVLTDEQIPQAIAELMPEAGLGPEIITS